MVADLTGTDEPIGDTAGLSLTRSIELSKPTPMQFLAVVHRKPGFGPGQRAMCADVLESRPVFARAETAEPGSKGLGSSGHIRIDGTRGSTQPAVLSWS